MAPVLFILFWAAVAFFASITLGGLDIFREPLVLLLVATLAPIVRDAIANMLRAVGKAGEDAAAKTPDPHDDVRAHARRLILEGIADAIGKGDISRARELGAMLGIAGVESPATGVGGATTPAAVPGARE